MNQTEPLQPQYIQANGLEFAYLAAGDADAPLALCLHGFPDTAFSFEPLLRAVADAGRRGVALFMRGYSPTALAEDGDYSALALGRDVLALIEHFGVEQADIVGHDWGAVAAYAAAIMRPDRVRRVVAAGVPHPRRFLLRPSRAQLRASRYMLRFQWPGAEKKLREDDFGALEELVREWSPDWEPPQEFLARVKAGFAEPARLHAALAYYRALPRLLLRRDAWNYLLRPVQVPARVICGARDGCILSATFCDQEHLFAADYELVRMPDAGHFMHLEQPQAFNRHVLEFLHG